MASVIWEFFGYRSIDESDVAITAAEEHICPFINNKCRKRLSDGLTAGVCTIKQTRGQPVICCPIRMYADEYRILKDVARIAFGGGIELKEGNQAITHAQRKGECVVAVFGGEWGRELRLPQRDGRGGYFVDWVLALINENGELVEFVAVEVQTIDTTGNYRDGREALLQERKVVSTTAGLNWENVSKRILPQLIYKGQVLQREELCRKGLFFVTPQPVYDRIMARLGGEEGLVTYALQPASITFLSYSLADDAHLEMGEIMPFREYEQHSTTVYRVQEAFNNVTLPEANVYRDAILAALDRG